MNKMVLHMGASGESVNYLNSILKDLEYKVSKNINDFDILTQSAVEAFQNDNYLTVNGIVDTKTWDKLEKLHSVRFPAVLAIMEEPTPLEEPDIPKNESRSLATPVLREGSKGSDVVRLQTSLKALGFFSGATDGSFGPITTKAVKDFQNAAGISADGIVGSMTWKAIENYTPPVVVPPNNTRPTLREGSKGDYVKELQSKLKEFGFLTSNPDGNFGPLTTAAVKKFQKEVGLQDDGVFGAKSWEALYNYIPNVVIPTPPTITLPTLREGSTGEYVKVLQEQLKNLGFYNGVVDGNFGAGTKAAVIAFQQSKGLFADGVVGAKTWESINIDAGNLGKRPILTEGSTGEYVKFLQERLKELGYYNGVIDGVFRADTTKAVKDFQNYTGLVSDGVVNEKTWIQLDIETSIPENNPVIREGSTGDYVKILQQKLLYLNYYSGSITGSFDSITTSSVIAFQRDNNLSPDGIVGRATWVKLYEATPPPIETIEPSGPKPTLRYGDTGPFVKFLQSELNKLLYYNGPISGEFDWQTEISVKSFQDVNRLTADGIVGRTTWFSLYALLPPPVKCD